MYLQLDGMKDCLHHGQDIYHDNKPCFMPLIKFSNILLNSNLALICLPIPSYFVVNLPSTFFLNICVCLIQSNDVCLTPRASVLCPKFMCFKRGKDHSRFCSIVGEQQRLTFKHGEYLNSTIHISFYRYMVNENQYRKNICIYSQVLLNRPVPLSH